MYLPAGHSTAQLVPLPSPDMPVSQAVQSAVVPSMKNDSGLQHTLLVALEHRLTDPAAHVSVPHPAPHSACDDCPIAALYVPAAQAVHSLWPPVAEYLPAGQFWHSTSVPSLKNCPARQALQEPPTYDPHLVTAGALELRAPDTVTQAPPFLLNFPAGQEAHAVCPPSSEYVPMGHCWHAISTPSLKKVPAAQHTLIAADTHRFTVEPAVHARLSVQLEQAFLEKPPAEGLYPPAGHEVHAVCQPLLEYVPTGQLWQDVCTPSTKYVPAMQHVLLESP